MMYEAIDLRLGWPAAEWETGPGTEMTEKWPAKWPADSQQIKL